MATGTIINPEGYDHIIELPKYTDNCDLSSVVAHALTYTDIISQQRTFTFRCNPASGKTANEVFGTSGFSVICNFSSANYGYGILISDNSVSFATFVKQGGTPKYVFAPKATTSYTPTITAPTATGFTTSNLSFKYKRSSEFLWIAGRFYISNAGTNDSSIVISYPSGITAVNCGVMPVGFVTLNRAYTGTPMTIRAEATDCCYIQVGAGGNNANTVIGSSQYVLMNAMIPII